MSDSGHSRLTADPKLNIRHGALSHAYELQRTLGQGAHGEAILATRLEDGEQVVVKQIRLSDMEERAMQEALLEVRLLSQFDHVNIVHYYECVLEDSCLNIVMEFAGLGDLSEVIQKRAAEKKPFTEDEIMFWFVQIVLGLFHVHSKNILHRDLKSQNIFIAEGNILKLGDFGISRVLNSDSELARTVIGTPYYLSPEICEDRPYNRKSDVWALGCVLYELVTLKKAFDGHCLPALIVCILKGKYPPVPTRYSTPLRNLVDSMLKQNPKDRPSVDAILRQAYVRQHVERYAQHVISLSPLASPPELGVEIKSKAEGPASSATASRKGAESRQSRPSPSAESKTRHTRPPLQAQQVECPSNQINGSSTQPSPAVATEDLLSPAAKREGAQVAASVQGSDVLLLPSAPNSAPQMVPNRLVGSTWINQQNAMLDELQDALQQQQLGGAGAVGKRANAAASPSQVPKLGRPGGAGGAAAAASASFRRSDRIAAAAGDAGLDATLVSGGRAKLLTLKQRQKDAELEANKQVVMLERERKKQSAAKRSHEAAAAVRSRASERQAEVGKGLLEQRAEEERKAKKAAELAQLLKDREEQKRKLQEDLSSHMAAHREQVRQARPKVNREELARMGAEFAARMQPGEQAATEANPMPVLVIDASPPQGKVNAAPTEIVKAPTYKKQPAASKAPTKAAPAKVLTAVAAEPPPWKAAKERAKAVGATAASPPSGGFPEVQIFTPYGNELNRRQQQQQQQQVPRSSSAESRQRGNRPPSGRNQVLDAWARRGKMELLEVLSQIQDVLADPDQEGDASMEDRGLAMDRAAVGLPGGLHDNNRIPQHLGHRPTSKSKGGMRLPPESDEVNSVSSDMGRVGVLSVAATDSTAGSSSSSSITNTTAAVNSQKVESLRLDLEKKLGQKTFIEAYRLLRQVQEDGLDEEGGGSTTVISQRELERLLGNKINLARIIHKLISLEDIIFS
ncbi:hypothetical protein CEUSTIGMA_g3459.t1 [Chlamydomonas eustigma]|uniref:non-specific serine/threonine protein kinase n=1 Tax=Chlamydomonas eustigma TaxID=1157962 RepID=A0A250WZ07_9CHLO|nr:hypothetical protein CEUSTIGMA_g3459.t1 [Chlamydomonas eustigma]|eukprot:GAX76016.1 hypothetical protein CEUSTIGMA_g3459.t1 [Chlamydomonas eustigma]